MAEDKLYIHKKQKPQQAKVIKRVFTIMFILFVIVTSMIIKDAFTIRDKTSIILFSFSLMVPLVLLIILIILNHSLKSIIKTIEIAPDGISFLFMDNVKFTLDKSNLLSIVAESQKLGEYHYTQFFISLSAIPVNHQLYATKRHNALLNSSNLSFTSVDLKNSNLDINSVINFLKTYYNEIFIQKSS